MEWMILPFRRYADFRGRSRRKEYWMFALFNVIIIVTLGMLTVAGGGFDAALGLGGTGPLGWLGLGLISLYGLAVFIPSIAVQVRGTGPALS